MNYDEEIEDIPADDGDFVNEPRRRRKTKEIKETVEYVSKDEMWNEIHGYYVSLGMHYNWTDQRVLDKTVFPDISHRLSIIIQDIATKMGYRANFCTYSWLDEMIGDATFKMVKAIRDCSFKCYTLAEVITTTVEDGGSPKTIIWYKDKKGNTQDRFQEDTDEFSELDGKQYVKFKSNPFGYFSRITTYSYLNRIWKENTLEETRRTFQEKTWDDLYSNEMFRNVRRPKFVDSDDSEESFAQ